MEIVIENPNDTAPIISPTTNPGYGTLPGAAQRPYRLAHMDASSPTADYYGTLPPRARPHQIPQQPDFDVGSSTVRRVDKSGLLEIVEPEPARKRPRNLAGSESPGHTGTLTRRIDRSGLLEAVPEVPDQQKSPELSAEELRGGRSIAERHLTGAEIDYKDQSLRACPRSSTISIDSTSQGEKGNSAATTPAVLGGVAASSSPYFRRNQVNLSLADDSNASPMIGVGLESESRSRGQFANVSITPKFLTDSFESRGRQYVDLTGATYTKTTTNSPILVSPRLSSGDSDNSDMCKAPPPDCAARLSPRSRGDRQSPLTVSAIPDVIEAHGSSRIIARSGEMEKDAPKGERAEAEGCEHSTAESLEETRVSFKTPNNKLLHNDNIQTLRVIILSEQL